ncbi:DUF6932 family protein [Burkholderia pseudomultivorans]|uniref:DUF6932 family protein n=1 Tax=Burkholderia pseudomultivorans TaxID=1207504 RepID=UPI0012DB718B|nr:hypothetical protein [Burkholderia pseudomultivorans]
MIPPFDMRGLLPAGIHSATWAEVSSYFVHDVRRTTLLSNAREFALTHLRPQFPMCPLFLAGSTFSDKPYPNDIEACLTIKRAELQLPDGWQKAFNLSGQHDSIKARYEVDFYLSIEQPGANDFSQFFQYVGDKTAAIKHLQAKDKRGIIEVTQWIHG